MKPAYALAKNNLSVAQNHTVNPALNSPTAEDYINQGKIYYSFRLYYLCIAASESALDIKPDYDLAYNNMCAAYNGLGQWDNAIKVGNRGLQINPGNTLLKNNLAVAVAAQNKSARTSK